MREIQLLTHELRTRLPAGLQSPPNTLQFSVEQQNIATDL